MQNPLDSVVYITIPENFTVPANAFQIDVTIPLPVQKTAGMEDQFDTSSLSWEMILAGILTIMAYEKENVHLPYYRSLLKAVRPDIKKELTEAAILKARNEDYDIADRIRLLKSIKLDYCNGIKPQLIIEEMDDDLECVEDYVSFIEVVDFFEVKEYLDNEDFKNRFYENTSREIDQASSDTDIDAIKVNLNIISMKFPDWDLDFEEEIEYQKMKLSEEDYEREDWEREKGDDSQIDEDIMINEMFTSLRIKED